MKFRFLLSTLALLLCVSLSAQTTAERAGNRAKNRVENRANNKVDQKVDRAVDDAFNAIGGLFKKKKKKNAPAPSGASEERTPANTGTANSTSPLTMGSNAGPWVPFTNPYTFSLRMEITEVKKNGKESVSSMEMAVDTEHIAIRLADEDQKEISRMIFNTQDGKTTMITTDKKGQKSGFRMKMPGVRANVAETVEEMQGRFTFEQTGERKTIDGYDCEKIIVRDTQEGTVTESWVTQDLDMDASDVYGGLMSAFGGGKAKMKKGPAQSLAGDFDGFPILTTSTDGDKTFISRYTDIRIGEANYNKDLLSTAGVQIQSLGF